MSGLPRERRAAAGVCGALLGLAIASGGCDPGTTDGSTASSSSAGGGGAASSTGGSGGTGGGSGGTGGGSGGAGGERPCEQPDPGNTVGTLLCESGAQPGYTLFSPIGVATTYLIDLDGRVVHEWQHALPPGQVAYLLEDGRLLRTTDPGPGAISAGGKGGGLELIAWDGNVEWSFGYLSDSFRAHHDVARLPNGNVVLIAWELVTAAEAAAAGRSSPLGAGELWPDHLIEVHPEANGGASVVWQWHAWDHLVQHNDNTLPNFGVASEHPGRIDIDLGGGQNADWLHINAVAYDEARDQLILSVHNTSEVWIIDHGTTTTEAAGPAGDILYRWGNPAAWGAGTSADQKLFVQHDAHLIADGLPGAGNLLLFNNGAQPARPYSTLDELVIPRAAGGGFELQPNGHFGPDQLAWTFAPADAFFSQNLGGAQRLSGGTTLATDGANGRLFEINPSGSMVWEYQLPIGNIGPLQQGSIAPSRPLFRAYRYEPSFAGLAGRDLTPGAVIELPR